LKKQLFHHGCDFRPHVSEENAHENVAKTLSRVELFENAEDTLSVRSNPLRAILETFSRWRTGVSLFCLFILGLISNLIACFQANLALLILQAD